MKQKNNKTFISNDITKEIYDKLNNYNINLYKKDVKDLGLEKTWNYLCEFIIKYGENEFININQFSNLYEIGLAIDDKLQKKKHGQYYTPDDVALVMSKWLIECEGENICDVGCGTGNLILTYLDSIGKKNAIKLLKEGKIYLYDYDKVALKICKTSIIKRYGLDLYDSINDILCDFLNKEITLPENCKVISNPPYSSINSYNENWVISDVIKDSHEWYSAFMEKIFEQGKSSVIITPFSFVSGNKFYSLRKKMCELGNGNIFVFDNVPGNIFYGKKHGIFNSNTANSVRASITILNSSKEKKGFKVSPMIRFKKEERKKLLKNDILESTLNDNLQIIDNKNICFKKIFKDLNYIYDNWITKSNFKFKDLLSKERNNYLIDIPNTCRYNTTASSKKLNRVGSITVYAKTEEEFYFLYCFINSSFAYWWWRIYDGGITYSKGLINIMPLPFNILSEKDKNDFKKIAKEMISKEK